SSRSSAAARHLVWALAIVAVLLVPAVVQFGPVWQVPLMPGAWVQRAEGPTSGHGRAGRSIADLEVWPKTASPGSHAPVTTEQPGIISVAEPTERSTKVYARATEAGWPVFLVVAWVAGALLAFARLLIGIVWALRVVRCAAAAT